MKIHRINFIGAFPQSFFKIPKLIYKNLPFIPEENPDYVQQLFKAEENQNEIILYTDHEQIRLVGIFPVNGDEARFGFWETTDNLLLNEEAFRLLEADARIRKKTRLVGPINFNTFNSYRIRIGATPSWNQFEKEPVNPLYYSSLLEKLSFSIKIKFESRLIKKENIPQIFQSKNKFLEELNNIPFEFIPLNPDSWQLYEDEIYHLVLEVFGTNPSFKAIPKEQFTVLYNLDFAKRLCPFTSVLFREKTSGKLVAMSFCYPDYLPLHLPEGKPAQFTRDYPKLKKRVMLAKSVGVHPEYRKKGLMTYLGAYGMVHLKELYDETIFCLMREDNFSLHFSKSLDYEAARYALYEKTFFY